jgi:hypothetical protein
MLRGHLSTLFTLLYIGACDTWHRVIVTTQLEQPVPLPCLRTALADLTGAAVVDSGPALDLPKGATGVGLTLRSEEGLLGFRHVSQFYFGDSAAALQTDEGQTGTKFTAAEADTIGAKLSGLLTSAAQRCDVNPKTGVPLSVRRD